MIASAVLAALTTIKEIMASRKQQVALDLTRRAFHELELTDAELEATGAHYWAMRDEVLKAYQEGPEHQAANAFRLVLRQKTDLKVLLADKDRWFKGIPALTADQAEQLLRCTDAGTEVRAGIVRWLAASSRWNELRRLMDYKDARADCLGALWPDASRESTMAVLAVLKELAGDEMLLALELLSQEQRRSFLHGRRELLNVINQRMRASDLRDEIGYCARVARFVDDGEGGALLGVWRDGADGWKRNLIDQELDRANLGV